MLGTLVKHCWHAPLPLQKSEPQHSCDASQFHPVAAQQFESAAHIPLQHWFEIWPHMPLGMPLATPTSKQLIVPQWP